MANAWAIIALSNEQDATPDYVLHGDGFTLVPVATDIPNPLWTDDGVQTSPDVNGETQFISQYENPQWDDDGLGTTPDADGNERYIAAGAANWNLAQTFSFSEYSIENIRVQKADFQKLHVDKAIDLHTVTVTVVPD